MRNLLKLTLPVAACLVLAACASGATPSASRGATATRTGGVLRLAQAAGDIGTADPHYASSTPDRALVDMVFNGLIRYQPGDATAFEPDLATALPRAMTNSEGKQVWSFALRKGVMCHPSDGILPYELSSDDVVYSLQKAANKTTSAYASDYAGMAFSAPDPYQVTVTLERPLSTALFYPRVANYAGGYILCRKAAEKLGPDGLKTHPVGTGPFVFRNYLPKEKVDLVANEAYFRGKPQLDGIEFRYIAELSSRELGLRGGQLDLIYGQADGKWIDQMSTASNVKVDVFGVGEVTTIYFNVTKPPFDNPKVRQGVASALNREDFLALYGTSVAEKVLAPVPGAFVAGGLSNQEVESNNLDYSFNVNRATQLLTDAGVGNGFSFSVVTSEMPAYRVMYESMQAQLARFGIKMDVRVVDHAAMHDQIRKDANPVIVYVAFRPTADAYLTQFFHSDSTVVTGKNPNTNFAHYDKVDEAIDGARNEPEAVRQAALWKQAQKTALQDMVAYPVMFTNQVYARTSNVEYGHDLKSELQLYPGIDETTRLTR